LRGRKVKGELAEGGSYVWPECIRGAEDQTVCAVVSVTAVVNRSERGRGSSLGRELFTK